MSFHPSASIDCHMQPMEIVMPLIQKKAEEDIEAHPQTITNSNSVTRSVGTRQRHNSGESSDSAGCLNYHKSSGQYVLRCPPSVGNDGNESRALWLTQVKTVAFYQALLGEFIGTMLLTLVCTSVGLPIASKSVPSLNGALAGGFMVATMIMAFGHISGAHVNPAVTVSFLVACQIDGLRAFCYVIMQLLGAVGASSILQFLAPAKAQANLGLTTITHDVTIPQAIAVEAIITFILCYTVHAICDVRREDIGGSKALAVGLAIIVGSLFGGPYTGGSMNPARSFGPATVMNSWENHWVYWIGPIIGGIIASIIYNYVLRRRPPIVIRSESQNKSSKRKGKAQRNT